MWGISEFPAFPTPTETSSRGQTNAARRGHEQMDPHLRSSQAVAGYEIQASDGTIGHVRDFIMDDQSWAITGLVAETGHWLSGKEVLIPLSQIDGISYEKSKIFVKLTKEGIGQEPEYYDPPVCAGDHGLESDANDSTLSNHQK